MAQVQTCECTLVQQRSLLEVQGFSSMCARNCPPVLKHLSKLLRLIYVEVISSHIYEQLSKSCTSKCWFKVHFLSGIPRGSHDEMNHQLNYELFFSLRFSYPHIITKLKKDLTSITDRSIILTNKLSRSYWEPLSTNLHLTSLFHSITLTLPDSTA